MPSVIVDVESDGPTTGEYSMDCFGAIIVKPVLHCTFYGKLLPVFWFSLSL